MTEQETVGATVDDQRIVAGLRLGDEAVFAELVNRYNGSLVRVAMRYVQSRAVAEEVVQDTWIGVIEGIDRFEGRSTLKTWLYKILIYRARARGERERRTTPMSALADDKSAPSVPTERFRGSDALWAGHWATPPGGGTATPKVGFSRVKQGPSSTRRSPKCRWHSAK